MGFICGLLILFLLFTLKSYSLLFSGLFYEAICFKYCLVLFCYLFFSPFSIAITSLEEERANIGVFSYFFFSICTLVLFVSSSTWCLGWAAACDCGTP